MSKISSDILQDAIAAVLKASKTKSRKFLETVELQFGLKNYDPNKDARISGAIVLPEVPRPAFKVCIIGNQQHIDNSKAAGLESMSQDEIKLLNKDKKKVKSLCSKYHAFLASSTLIRQIPRLAGPGFNKAGKFPSVINPNDDVAAKVEECKATVKFALKSKKSLCLGVAVANVNMTPEQIMTNVILAINYFVGLLPKNWQQVKRVYIKSTMGPAQKIFGM